MTQELHACIMARVLRSASWNISACILLTLLVRGFDGTTWISLNCVEYRQLLSRNFAKFIQIVKADHMYESLLEASPTWTAHCEGRHTSQSGIHPLEELGQAAARKRFV